MARTVGIGIQSFDKNIKNNCFYVDKTDFIREWWESRDDVTLIARPRRFGKTLNMSMLEQFFSVKYAGREDLFEGLSIWQHEEYREIQGTYPVISLSFANIKEPSYEMTRERINQLLVNLYEQNSFLLEGDFLSESEKQYFSSANVSMNDAVATLAIYQLSNYLSRYYGKKVIILLDEYDTPMHSLLASPEAIGSSPSTGELHACMRDKLVAFTRSLFNATFKTNPWLERGIMTGITRVSNVSLCEPSESVFSDLNNLKVVTTTSDEYATSFGFTEEEVFAALDECNLSGAKDDVKRWYDGFTFGEHTDIYNPWSIINFLDTGKFTTYWANTSSNSLIGKLLREGSRQIKISFEGLLKGEHMQCPIDEQIVYNRLDNSEAAIWSLLLASGYLKVVSYEDMEKIESRREPLYELALTNHEVERMFDSMVRDWFAPAEADYNDFVKALLLGDLDAMNEYMNRVALATFSSFDTGKRSSEYTEPERFYHGFVLGLLVDLSEQYVVQSNRESGFGRYDVMLEPKSREDDAIILEFKVYNERKEKDLEDTVQAALKQIEDKRYDVYLKEKGIPAEHIRKYGFAFEGKKVLIG